jgi:hypothetical protein
MSLLNIIVTYLSGMSKTLQGKFRPQNPEKYKGDPSNIIYRSSWERIFMRWADNNKAVKKWQSEEKAIWYYNPITKKNARYFPDFLIEYENKAGILITELIEVKPQKQIDGPPVQPKRRTRAWMNAVQTYVVNRAKWEAAIKWCEDRGYNFRLISEKHLGLTNK